MDSRSRRVREAARVPDPHARSAAHAHAEAHGADPLRTEAHARGVLAALNVDHCLVRFTYLNRTPCGSPGGHHGT